MGKKKSAKPSSKSKTKSNGEISHVKESGDTNEAENNNPEVIEYVDYVDESMLPDIQALVSKDLSEPYSVFTYRYFLHNWPQLCICVYVHNKETDVRKMIGTIISKADEEYGYLAGYIAMLAVDSGYRHLGIGSTLVNKGIERMVEMGCGEIILETEVTNQAALKLYQKLGFIREEKLTKYYLNGNDAYRLKLYIDFYKVEERYRSQNRPFPFALPSPSTITMDSLKESLNQISE